MISNKELNRTYTILSNNIRYYRKQNNLTQEGLAEVCDLSTSYIKQIESSKEFKNISLTTMLKIAQALNVDVGQLFDYQ